MTLFRTGIFFFWRKPSGSNGNLQTWLFTWIFFSSISCKIQGLTEIKKSGNAGSKWNRHGISDGVCDYHHHHHHHRQMMMIIITWWWSSSWFAFLLQNDNWWYQFFLQKKTCFFMVGSRSPEITSTKVEASEWTKKAPFWECKAPWYIFLSLPSISKHKSMVPYWNLHKLPKLFTAQKISQQNHPKMSHHSPQQNSRFQSSTSNFSRNLDSSQSALSGCRSTEIRRLRVLQGQIHWTKSSNMCQALTTIAIHLRSHKMACDESYEVRWIFCRLISKCIETYWKKHMFKKASTYTYVYIYVYLRICANKQWTNEIYRFLCLTVFIGCISKPFLHHP